jgi:hypothetical protein
VVCSRIAPSILVAALWLGCGGDDAASTSSQSADAETASADARSSDQALDVNDVSDRSVGSDVSPDADDAIDAPSDSDAPTDVGPSCADLFAAQAPSSDCVPRGTQTISANTVTTCQAACGAGMGCPVSYAWHDVQGTSTSVTAFVDIKVTVDIALTGPSAQSCTLTQEAKNVRCIASLGEADGSTTIQSVACAPIEPSSSGCNGLIALVTDAATAQVDAALRALVLGSFRKGASGVTCADMIIDATVGEGG